jgi:aspartate carbamoyltransferase regulatory subunit
MLNISGVQEGYVLDHIKAGTALKVYRDLGLEQHDYTVAIIMNVKSNKMGRKDILKIECPIGSIDLDVLGFIDHNITVNIVKDGFISDKLKLKLPKEVHNVIRCKNPRCITTIEQELEQVFVLTDPEHEVYRCKYCEEKYERK